MRLFPAVRVRAALRLRRGRAAWCAVLCLLLPLAPARATHIVGGELELQHQVGENYTLTLNLYFDAINGNAAALDADLTAGIFEKGSNRRVADVLLPLTSNTFVAYTNPACTRPTLSTRKLVYSKGIILPAGTYNNAAGYYVAVERCCRNNGIQNIVAPGSAAQTFYLEFPAVVRGGRPFYDSTPRIFPPLGDYACVNELFTYDFGGQDADGDSLAYDLVTPLNGHATVPTPKPAQASPAPYTLITWQPGLGVQNQIPGSPALGINARTGRLTVRPRTAGLFVFGVRCQEFRGGVKMGETRRDFQLYALACPVNRPPRLAAQTGAANVPYRPGRDTLRLLPGGDRCLRLRYTDPDPNSALTLTLRPVNFTTPVPTFTTPSSGTVRAAGQPDTLTAQLCFAPCQDTQGRVFLLDVIVADNGCSLPKHDTVRVAFTAVRPPNGPPQLSTTAAPLPLHARIGDVVSFEVLATDPDNDPLTLTMSGRGFDPAALGATLTLTAAPGGGPLRGRVSWPVTCAALDGPQPHEFVFTATAQPCAVAQTAVLTVPVAVDYANAPPVLITTFPLPAPPGDGPALVRLPVGGTYTATLAGSDADRDPLALTATGQGFDLAAAGMRFTAQNGVGQASGAFRWEASCAAVTLHQNLVVAFRLAESTCRPVPQTLLVRFEVISPDTLAFRPPNIITPNGDGLNDAFALDQILPPDFCDRQFAGVRIFSRWGQSVYESSARTFRWGGAGVGGTYYYLISFTDGRRFKGWLEVVP